ncbi:hypothetical protein QYE76_071423 [Lolium multiflorum]|uniref:Retrotransposon gag domain-containing protein n=1 Tax=Lolium multiflorum TaxID=4521 RepID=A0AAD8SLB7_LOLMU|nr:hypothetical protein QYE76_071423 [Lolium multiflorum]
MKQPESVSTTTTTDDAAELPPVYANDGGKAKDYHGAAEFFHDLLQQNKVERPEYQGVTLSDFQNTKPISFAYAPEPMDAEDWLMDTERKLNTVGCNDLEKVKYATHLLCGPAASWWDNIVAVYPADKVFTWDEFKRKFRESNVPESIVERSARI